MDSIFPRTIGILAGVGGTDTLALHMQERTGTGQPPTLVLSGRQRLGHKSPVSARTGYVPVGGGDDGHLEDLPDLTKIHDQRNRSQSALELYSLMLTAEMNCAPVSL